MKNEYKLNSVNELTPQLIEFFNEYKKNVNHYTLSTLGCFAATVSSYISEIISILLREKYFELWNLSRSELICKYISEMNKHTSCRNNYERITRYMEDYMNLHSIFRQITVRNHHDQELLNVSKDGEITHSQILCKSLPALIPSENYKQIIQTGNLAVFQLDINNKIDKVGTLEACISTALFEDLIIDARKKIPCLKAMNLVNEKGQILYPSDFKRRREHFPEVIQDKIKETGGYYIPSGRPAMAIGYSSIAKLPINFSGKWTVICELIVSNEKI